MSDNKEHIEQWMEDTEKFPNHVVIRPGRSVEIDGKEFPWYLTSEPDPVVVKTGRSQLTTLTLTIPCRRVEIVDVDLPTEGHIDNHSSPVFRTSQ
jgi:hypothetical protein